MNTAEKKMYVILDIELCFHLCVTFFSLTFLGIVTLRPLCYHILQVY